MDTEQVVQRLKARSKPALHIAKAIGSGGFSKLGGLPNFPSGLGWPKWKGKPLSFLAQLELAELPKRDCLAGLPAVGRLYFFYDQEQSTWGFDPADVGSWRVIYSIGAPLNVPQKAPVGLAEEFVFQEKFVEFREITSIPDRQRIEDTDGYADLSDEAVEAAIQLMAEPFQSTPQHQLGGYPYPVQNDTMELECQVVSHGVFGGDSSGYQDPRDAHLAANAKEWKLLLQLDSDDETSMMWGDVGKLYFWIRSSDLAERDFSRVWMILQCC